MKLNKKVLASIIFGLSSSYIFATTNKQVPVTLYASADNFTDKESTTNLPTKGKLTSNTQVDAKDLSTLMGDISSYYNNVSMAETPVDLLNQVDQAKIRDLKNELLKSDQNEIAKLMTMRDEAFKFGLLYGLYSTWNQIEDALFSQSGNLSRIFNFNSMYLDNGKLQPPILDTSDDVNSISDGGKVFMSSNKVYRVKVPAMFRNKPLSWMDFLIPDNLNKPSMPDSSTLPTNKLENYIWQKFLFKGWNVGANTALEQFNKRIASLKSAFTGMVLYKKLLLLGIAQKPIIIDQNTKAITDDNNQLLSINNNKKIIAQPAILVKDINKYKAILED